MRIINNTDLNYQRLLVLYSKEINTVKHLGIESIVFNDCSMLIYGIDCLLLEIDDSKTDEIALLLSLDLMGI